MNNYQPDDSLDNLSNLQQGRQRQLQAQVKQQFAQGLQKLQSSETREVGITELKKLIEHYREQQYLRGYIAILKALKPNASSGTKEHQILIVSLLAQTYKKQLLDTLDKPPSLLKTTFRLVEILHGYFNDHSPTVQQACARALLDLTTHSLSQQTMESTFSIIYAPLISILKSGVDKGSQATASACLSELINYNRKVGNQEVLLRLSPQMLGVILRVNSQYHELFQAILGMLESQGLKFLQGKVVAFLAKILSVIDGTRETNSTNTTNLNAYMCKVNVCKIIEKIAKLLPSTERDKLFELRIPDALQQATRHRIIQVQMSANKALKAWKGETTEDSPPKSRGLASLEDKRNSKKRERSKSKQETAKIESELTFMKQDLQKLVKGGWGANNRAKNYVKKGTGVGGGFHGKAQLSPPSKSGGKSHKEHFQQLRQFIKKSAQQNKNLDRFGKAGAEGESHSKSPGRSKSPAGSRSPPAPARSKSPGRQSNPKKSVQNEDVGFVQDEGDQMVYMPQKHQSEKANSILSKDKSVKDKFNTRMNRFADLDMNESQANQLMNHQQSLMEQANKMQIKYYTEKSEQNKKIKEQKAIDSKMSKVDKMSQDMRIPLNQNQKLYTPQQPQMNGETSLHQQLNKQKAQSPKFKGLSQEELEQLVQDNNLSQVSQNLNDVLSQSDIQAFHKSDKKSIDSNIMEPVKGTDGITIKDIVAEKKQKKSSVSKFLKKEPDQVHEQPHAPELISKINMEQQGVSLNFTESQESRTKSPQKRDEIQFTLNPKQKFSTLKPQNQQNNQKQVEEDIVMSEYQQSFPRDQPLPRILPKVAPISQIPLRYSLVEPQFQKKQPPKKNVSKKDVSVKQVPKKQLQPEDRIDYQKLIKNPPKIQHVSEQSRLKGSKASIQSYPDKGGLQQKQSEDEDLHAVWLEILGDMTRGEVNSAYEQTLQMDDPIYLLRLLLLSKLPLKKLSADTVKGLWRKFMEIYSQKFIEVLTLGMLSEGNQLGLLSKCLSVQQLQQALLGLYELSGNTKGKLSYKAATLYNDIEKNLHGE